MFKRLWSLSLHCQAFKNCCKWTDFRCFLSLLIYCLSNFYAYNLLKVLGIVLLVQCVSGELQEGNKKQNKIGVWPYTYPLNLKKLNLWWSQYWDLNPKPSSLTADDLSTAPSRHLDFRNCCVKTDNLHLSVYQVTAPRDQYPIISSISLDTNPPNWPACWASVLAVRMTSVMFTDIFSLSLADNGCRGPWSVC